MRFFDEVGFSEVVVGGFDVVGVVVVVGSGGVVVGSVGRGGVVVSVGRGGCVVVPVGSGGRVGCGGRVCPLSEVVDVPEGAVVARSPLVLGSADSDDETEPVGCGGGGSTGGTTPEVDDSVLLELDPGVWIVMSGPALGC